MAGIRIVNNEEDVILISLAGILIRMHVEDIAVQSRYGSGVRVMRLSEDDQVVTVARTDRSEEAEVAKPDDAPDPEDELTPEELAALEAADAQSEAEITEEADDAPEE